MSPGEIDTQTFFFINRDLQNRLFDALMPFITSKAYIIILPFLIWFFIKEKRQALLIFSLFICSMLLADWGSNILKHLFERQRPCNVLNNVHLLVGCTNSFSLPSNHASNAFAFAIPFLLLSRNNIRYTFLFIASLVCFSRVYVGVHYPSDVIAGALFGTLISISVIGLYGWSFKRFKEKPYTTILFIFLLAISLFRIYYITQGPLDLSPDEAHYWEWSRRLDLSYYSKGPMIAYLIALGTSIFGDNVFGIRIMAVIFSLLSSIILYRIGRDLYDERVGLASAILMQIVPLYSTFGVLFTIDSPFIFFWILSLYLFYKAANSRAEEQQSSRTVPVSLNSVSHWHRSPTLIYWFLLGLSVGLGLLTKYTMAFFYASAFLYLIVRPVEQQGSSRALLSCGSAALISLLVFSPVIIWNASNDWVTLRHTAGQAHIVEGLQISLKSFFEFIGSQLGVLTPVLFVLIIIALWKVKGTMNSKGRFLFWFSAPVIMFFILKSLQGKVQANWALPGYTTGLIAFSAIFFRGWESLGKKLKATVIAGLSTSLLVTAIAHYPSILNLPPKQDPTARIRGWKELGDGISKIYAGMSTKGHVFIFSDSYQVSSELAFYVKGHPVTYSANLGRRMNQYDLWPGFNTLIHYNAIFVTIGDTQMPERLAKAFNRHEKRVFSVYTKDRKLRDYSIFICYDFKGMEQERPKSY